MIVLEALTNKDELNFRPFYEALEDEEQETYLYYDKTVDSLVLSVVPRSMELVVLFVDDCVGVLFDPKTRNVVGIQIEALRKAFVRKYEGGADQKERLEKSYTYAELMEEFFPNVDPEDKRVVSEDYLSNEQFTNLLRRVKMPLSSMNGDESSFESTNLSS